MKVNEAEALNNEIAIVGELSVDLIASGLGSEPILGQEILAESFEITLGSASAIFACGIANLGRGVTFISRVGADHFGAFCAAALARKGISTNHIEISKSAKTGVTIVLSTRQDRALVTYPGAIAELGFADVPLEALENHRHLHLTSYFLQSNLRPDFARLVTEAKGRGLTVSFDPNSDPTQSWDAQIFDVIKQTDILFLNETEAKQLTSQIDLGAAIRRLGSYCPCVVIKLGSKGAAALYRGEFASVDGFAVNGVDTTGAGDSFAAGFVHVFLDGKDLRDCLTFGNACGALSTTQAGGTNGQPNLRQVQDFLAKSEPPAVAGGFAKENQPRIFADNAD
ncbi:MAG: sugar kinase [Pyrinomonadaceae bacterium]|nr:sugar kinase [Pyrinomonadaceae bacterium]